MKIREVCSCSAMIEAEDQYAPYVGICVDTWRKDHNHDMTAATQPLEPPMAVCAGCGDELPEIYTGVGFAKFCSFQCEGKLLRALVPPAPFPPDPYATLCDYVEGAWKCASTLGHELPHRTITGYSFGHATVDKSSSPTPTSS